MRIIFLILPHVEVMDLAGPLQVFREANRHGARFETQCCAMEPEASTEQGLWLGRLALLPEPRESDIVLVPGGPVATHMKAPNAILDGRSCTTHWSRIEDLRRRFPKAHILEDRLYVMDGPVFTSAGIASGIDVALALVEAEYGPNIASLAAREMVVYLRRDGSHRQQSVYLDHAGSHRRTMRLPGCPTASQGVAGRVWKVTLVVASPVTSPYCSSGSKCPIIVQLRPFARGIPIALFFYRVDP